MESEELRKRFAEAYAIRFSDDDIDQKPTRYKDKATGQFREGKPLSYLNWAVAWRTMLEVYPEANYGVIEDNGSPLWNVNGYGMVKCYVEVDGIRRVETFPIMQGGQNESMKVEEIDGRDINDSIQRGLTKAVARWGIGLYIYEGKIDAPKKPQEARRATETTRVDTNTNKGNEPLTGTGYKFLEGLMKAKAVAKSDFRRMFGYDYDKLTYAQYREVASRLKAMEDAPEGDELF